MTYTRKIFLVFCINANDSAGATNYNEGQWKEDFLAGYTIQTGSIPFAGNIVAVSINAPNVVTDTNLNEIFLKNAVEVLLATVTGASTPTVFTNTGSVAFVAGDNVSMGFRDSAQAGNNSCTGVGIGVYT